MMPILYYRDFVTNSYRNRGLRGARPYAHEEECRKSVFVPALIWELDVSRSSR